MKKLMLIGVVLFIASITITMAQTANDEVRPAAPATQSMEPAKNQPTPAPASEAVQTNESAAPASAHPACAGKEKASCCKDKNKSKCDKAKGKKCCSGKKEASKQPAETKPNN